MKTQTLAKPSALPAIVIFSCLAALNALAHPGHYHPPGEEDEFDALRADWLHLHGWWEVSFALIAVAAVAVFVLNTNRRVRLAAALAFGGSLALIAAA
jgi:hypothetical protein